MTLLDTLDKVSDRAFKALVARQEAVVTGLEDAVKPLHERFADTPIGDRLPDTVAVVDRAFGITEKFVHNQHEFTVKVLKTLRPTHVPPAKKTATRTPKVA
jgi:hypothetical protein